VEFHWQTDMRKRSTIVFAVTLLALALFSSSDAEAQDTSTKRDNPKVILEGKVIDDQVVDERGKLIAGATVRAMYASKVDYASTPENVMTASDGTFKLSRKERPLYLKATTADQRQAGFVRVNADQQQAIIRVAPLARATGQLVDKTGKPVQLGYIWYLAVDHDPDLTSAFGMFTDGVALFDSDGRFIINGLLPGQQYQLAFMRRGGNHPDHLTYLVPPSAGELNLGRLLLRNVRFPTGPEPLVRLVTDNPPAALERQQRLSRLLTAILADTPYDFVVQRLADTNESTNLLPENLAENLVQVNGVKRVGPRTLDCALLDLVNFDKYGVTDVLVSGWLPSRCPRFARITFLPGGRLLKDNDENAVVLSQGLAAKLGKKIGDNIELYESEPFQVVGIYESPIDSENYGLMMPLPTMQRVMGTPGEATGFAIASDRPIDEKGLEDLRQRLEAVQPGLDVKLLRRSGNDQSPKAQPN
jgi:hypothetical protein